jgi:nucleoside-diphosphate-sugar epimerase
MKIFITGITGYIGHALALKLVQQGHTIHALVRNPETLPTHTQPGIILFKGDLHDESSVQNAMQGCSQVYHVAGDVRIWVKDNKEIYANNTDGASHVFSAALKSKIEKVVFTSSGGVMGPSFEKPLTEDDSRSTAYDIVYEHSKKLAENIAVKFAAQGLNLVIVRPTKVYGPGQVKSPLSIMQFIARFIKSKRVFIPAPGNYIANFSFIDDIVEGHIRAMEYGRSGEKYILGGENVSFKEFFEGFNKLMGNTGQIIKAPKWMVKTFASLQLVSHKLWGATPRFTPASVENVFTDHRFSSEKAVKELNYQITPLNEGIKKTFNFLNTTSHE